MMEKVIKIFAIGLGLLLTALIGLMTAALFDAESYVLVKLYEETGLTLPKSYVVERSSGSYVFDDSVYFHFKFNDGDFNELVYNLESAPQNAFELMGRWVNSDSTYRYLLTGPSGSGIGQIWIEKETKLMKVSLDSDKNEECRLRSASTSR